MGFLLGRPLRPHHRSLWPFLEFCPCAAGTGIGTTTALVPRRAMAGVSRWRVSQVMLWILLVIPGRASWREPGIHNHMIRLFIRAGAPSRLGNAPLWLWIPGSLLRTPRNDGRSVPFRFHEFVKSKIIPCLVGQITGTGPLSPRRQK